MAWKHLGEQFDIHGGGIDLVFPHHENELAQTCCAFHEDRMASVWMHNGFLQVESEKMSKSLGNFVTIRELLADWPGDVLRLTMLKTHYRQPIDWRKDELLRSQSELRSWADLISNMALEPSYEAPDYSLMDQALLSSLCDDLNTPLALRRLHELGDQARRDRSKGIKFATNAAYFGFSQLNRPGFFTSVVTGDVPPEKENVFSGSHRLITNFKNYSANNFQISASSSSAELKERGILAEIGGLGQVVISFLDGDSEPFEVRVQRLISERNEARFQKDFEKSDRIRDELAKMGVVLKDGKDASGNSVTTWEIAR
jgi:cysteinyl-tRNA synthetase